MYITNKQSETGGGNILSFGQLWQRYFAYWPLFILLFAVAAAGAWVYLFVTPPQYLSDAKILINDEKKGSEDSKSVEAFSSLDPKKIIENETEVVQSRTLIDAVVKELALYAPVYQQLKYHSVSAYATSPLKVEIDDVANLRETKNIKFIYDSAKQTVTVDTASYPVNQWVVTPYGRLRFTHNTHAAAGLGNGSYYFQLISVKKVTAGIQERLKVASISKLSTILDLNIKDEVPERGEDILNSLLVAYNKAILEQKNTLAANTIGFVQARLNTVTKNLDSIEARIQNYKSSATAVDIGTQGRLFLENVSANDQKIGDINMQLAVLDEVQKYAESKDNKDAIVPSTLGVNDPVLSQLLTRLYEAEIEYEKLKRTEGENYPSVVSLVDQIAKLRPSILQNIKSQRQSLEASKANLTSTNSVYATSLQSIPGKERELIEINREQTIKNNTYAFLLQKREEAALSNASMVTDNRVIDRAQSSVLPVSASGKTIYGIAMVVALVLGISLITLKETFNNKVLYRREIEEMTSKPIIGEIIFDKSKNAFSTGAGRGSFIAEQFRQLRVALSFLRSGSKKKKILVTSSIPGEGKSFVATNLALAMATPSKRSVLVELDLSHPGISKNFNAIDNPGVTDYLLGERTAEEIVFQTDVNANMFLVSAGAIVSDPSELLANGKIELLLKYLDANFDYVIIDTPPVNLVSDAYVLSAFCDVSLYVIRHNYTAKVLVQRIDKNNKINRLNNMALVFNGVRPRGFVKNSYGYGYGYGYAYNQKRGKKLAS